MGKVGGAKNADFAFIVQLHSRVAYGRLGTSRAHRHTSVLHPCEEKAILELKDPLQPGKHIVGVKKDQ